MKKETMKYYLLLLAILFIGMTQRAWAIDGEVFTVEATDGIVLRYTVINSVEKTCMLGITETKEDEYYKTAFADGSAGKGTGMAWISTGLVIPSEANGYTVTEIASEALEASHLTSITIPSTVTKIGDMAFYSTYISRLEIPASVKSVGKQIAVSNNLRQIVVEEGNSVYDSRDNCNAIIETATNTLILGCEETNIVEGIEAIGESALLGNFNVYGPVEISIPKTVTRIDGNPFYDNQKLVKISVAEDNPVFDSRDNCNAIINTATEELVTGCKATIIPDGVKTIGTYAFALLGTSLDKITIPESVETISDAAFYKTQLQEITLPKNLKTIGKYAFRQSSSLKSVTIPATVRTIEDEAFMGCAGLEEVISMIDEPAAISDHTFTNRGWTWTEATLYVPSGTKDKYVATDGWKNFKNIVEIGDQDNAVQHTLTQNKKPSTLYNLQGMKMANVSKRKGIYILDGHTIIIK